MSAQTTFSKFKTHLFCYDQQRLARNRKVDMCIFHFLSWLDRGSFPLHRWVDDPHKIDQYRFNLTVGMKIRIFCFEELKMMMKNWEEEQKITLVKRTESVVLKFLEYPKYTKSSIQFCISVSFVSAHGILTRVLYREKMRIANCDDKLLQKNSLDYFLVIADELIVKKVWGKITWNQRKREIASKPTLKLRGEH